MQNGHNMVVVVAVVLSKNYSGKRHKQLLPQLKEFQPIKPKLLRHRKVLKELRSSLSHGDVDTFRLDTYRSSYPNTLSLCEHALVLT